MARVVVGGQSPDALSGLVGWWKADAITGLADGAAVASWADSSGNGRTATQAVGANQPIYKTAILNGKPVVRFDGVPRFLLTTAFASALSTGTVILVGKSDQTGPQFFFDGDLTGNARWAIKLDVGSLCQIYQGVGISNTTANVNTPSVVSGNFVSANAALYVNGAARITGFDAGAHQLSSLTIGARFNQVNGLVGDIAEIVVYNRALSTVERQNVEAWLAAKYAIAGVPGSITRAVASVRAAVGMVRGASGARGAA